MFAQNSTTPTPKDKLGDPKQEVIAAIVLASMFVLLGLLAFFRARRYGRSDWSSPTFVFFLCIVGHCIIRAIELPLHATGYISDIGSLPPSITFQGTLYIYLRIWQVQCDTFDAHESSDSRVNFPLKLSILWLILWVIAIALDQTFEYIFSEGYPVPYITYLYNTFNYIIIAAGFLHLGEQMRVSMSGLLGEGSPIFERHVMRVKIFFSIACLIRAVVSVIQNKYPNLRTVSFFEPFLIFLVEFLPLLASILSMYYVQLQQKTSSGT